MEDDDEPIITRPRWSLGEKLMLGFISMTLGPSVLLIAMLIVSSTACGPVVPSNLEYARSLSSDAEPEHVVKAYGPVPHRDLEDDDRARLKNALLMLATRYKLAGDLKKANEQVEAAAALGNLPAEYDAWMQDLYRQRSRDGREGALTAASDKVNAAKAERDGQLAGAGYRAAALHLEEALRFGAKPEDHAALKKSIDAGIARDDARIVRETCASGKEARRNMAGPMVEEALVANGWDVDVSVSGTCGENIRIKFILWNKPLVYQFEHGKWPAELKAAGFKKVRLDGYDQWWEWEL